MLNIKYKLASIALLFVLITHIQAQNKGGDICAFALDMPVSSTKNCELGILTNENTELATQTSLDPPCDRAGVNRDLWYSFIAPMNGEVILNIDLGTAIRIEAAVFKTCNNISIPNTVFCYSGNADGQKVTGLITGQKYLLQLWSDEFAAGTFDLCLTTTASTNMNDECVLPTSLIVANSSSPCDASGTGRYLEDNFGATSDFGNGIPSCGSFGEGKDVWFSFKVPNSGEIHINLSDAGGPKDWSMALYSGSCDDLKELACDDDSGAGLFPAISKSGLTPGSTILVRVWEYGGDDFGPFYINLINPTPLIPENDMCTNATELVLVSGNADCVYYRTCGFNVNATPSGEQPSPSCSEFGTGIDTWYKLAVPNTVDEIKIELSQQSIEGSQDWAMSVYKGNCGNLQQMACDDDSGNGLFPSLDLTGLGSGDMLYIRVWDFGSNDNGSYNVCATFSGVLPIVFQELTATTLRNTNVIYWSIIDDFNTKMFELESCSSEDFGNWNVLGSILPHASADEITEYEFVDKKPSIISYYRIRVTSNSGEIEYSKVVSIIKDEMDSPDNINVYPNPVKNQLYISFDEISIQDGDINLEIIDINGKNLLQSKQILGRGESTLILDVANLKTGNIYILNVTSKDKNYQKRFVK